MRPIKALVSLRAGAPAVRIRASAPRRAIFSESSSGSLSQRVNIRFHGAATPVDRDAPDTHE
jgi:hypothetical protein